jgi:putative endopeptidase
MSKLNGHHFQIIITGILFTSAAFYSPAVDAPPKVPRFSISYMDKSVAPGEDFFRYANGSWLKNNPVPPDKSRWASFIELQDRNWYLIHGILESVGTGNTQANSPSDQVARFYRSAMDTNRLESLGLKPLASDMKRIDAVKSTEDIFRLLGDFHQRGIAGCFASFVTSDAKNASIYAFYFSQGGLAMPDRDYYLTDAFAKQREAYAAHVARMLMLIGESADAAKADSKTVLELETVLAKANKSRVDLRDPIANYHKVTAASLEKDYPDLPLKTYLAVCGLDTMPDLIVRQPEFFSALDQLVKERTLADWKAYLRWNLIHSTAPYLNSAAEEESFAFEGKVISEQQEQEPRWERTAKVIDVKIGEALGELFVIKYFPAAARVRMNELVENLKAVFLDRLHTVSWMTDATRAKAIAKFERFTQKIGHPDKFRDYSKIVLRPDDYLGNVERATAFESQRQFNRVGKPVDTTEWTMTPETVNAYFSPTKNEIVFPAGILQPPFFDVEVDDAVNYGAIGVVIGHEITHGYDDQGRKYDSKGNLNDWWTPADAKAFEERAQKVVDQYNGYEALPGLHVNGKLTLGENLADLGGTSIAYEALQRALAKDPKKRKNIDGFTPEQRFFLSLAQVYRVNWREAELRRRITVDPHSPGQFRGIGPHVNMQEFYDAFAIKEGAPMWRAPELRAKIW